MYRTTLVNWLRCVNHSLKIMTDWGRHSRSINNIVISGYGMWNLAVEWEQVVLDTVEVFIYNLVVINPPKIRGNWMKFGVYMIDDSTKWYTTPPKTSSTDTLMLTTAEYAYTYLTTVSGSRFARQVINTEKTPIFISTFRCEHCPDTQRLTRLCHSVGQQQQKQL